MPANLEAGFMALPPFLGQGNRIDVSEWPKTQNKALGVCQTTNGILGQYHSPSSLYPVCSLC